MISWVVFPSHEPQSPQEMENVQSDGGFPGCKKYFCRWCTTHSTTAPVHINALRRRRSNTSISIILIKQFNYIMICKYLIPIKCIKVSVRVQCLFWLITGWCKRLLMFRAHYKASVYNIGEENWVSRRYLLTTPWHIFLNPAPSQLVKTVFSTSPNSFPILVHHETESCASPASLFVIWERIIDNKCEKQSEICVDCTFRC